MNLQTTKIELIEMLLSTKKATVLKKIRAILEEEQPSLTQEQYQIIDARKENHQNGNSQSFTWEEVKSIITKK